MTLLQITEKKREQVYLTNSIHVSQDSRELQDYMYNRQNTVDMYTQTD